MPPRIGKRQVHLDFHNSELLKGIGSNFDAEQFKDALKCGRLDSINLFAKCHHSWSYYPTKVGAQHPNLEFDLLGAQLKACKEIDIAAHIYYTFGWSANDAEAHPEWCVRDREGEIVTNGGYDPAASKDASRPGFTWKFLCANTGYHDHIRMQVEELCQRYTPDGFWFDIYQVYRLCYCEQCRAEMTAAQIDINDEAAVEAFNATIIKRHCKALRNVIERYHPNASVFFNGTTAIDHGSNFRHSMFENNAVQDLEDLPTVWGGYDKLPLQSKYFLQAGYAISAMSGKFHTAWGEFGGFKHPNALRYEAASMIAYGANCNFGDQLHPSGKMDLSTYKNIGEAFEYVESIESYGVGGQPTSRLGFWRSFDAEHDEGLAKILLETHNDFEVANFTSDLSRYAVVIIPGVPCLEDSDAERLNQFAKEGGHLIVLGSGVFKKGSNEIALDIGAEYQGDAQYDIDYMVVTKAIQGELIESPFLNYRPAKRFKPEPGVDCLASIHEPYFSRTYGAYCSHQNTPNRLEAASHPAILRKGTLIFIAHELDWMYLKHGARLHRDLLSNILKMVYERPMVRVELPSAGRLSLLHQPENKRYIAHLLYAPPIQRGECEVIEDLPPLHDVALNFDLPEPIQEALLIPDNEILPIIGGDSSNEKSVHIPKFSCHCAIVLNYA